MEANLNIVHPCVKWNSRYAAVSYRRAVFPLCNTSYQSRPVPCVSSSCWYHRKLGYNLLSSFRDETHKPGASETSLSLSTQENKAVHTNNPSSIKHLISLKCSHAIVTAVISPCLVDPTLELELCRFYVRLLGLEKNAKWPFVALQNSSQMKQPHCASVSKSTTSCLSLLWAKTGNILSIYQSCPACIFTYFLDTCGIWIMLSDLAVLYNFRLHPKKGLSHGIYKFWLFICPSNQTTHI